MRAHPQPPEKPSASGKKSKFFPASRRKALFILLLSLVLVLGAALLLRLLGDRAKKEPAPEQTPHVSSRTATIAAVGDLRIDDLLLESAQLADGSYDFSPYFLNVAAAVSDADLTLGNLELTFSGAPYGTASDSAPQSLAGALKNLGFDILQTANSKSLANGMAGLEATYQTLTDAGISPLGTYPSQDARDASGGVLLREVNGIRIAFFAYTKGFDGMAIPEGNAYCADVLYKDYATTYSQIDEAAILQTVEQAKALEPDIIVAMLHWGSEDTRTVSSSQKELAALLQRSGVDVILGSHSHLIGAMDYDPQKPETFTAYSLGDFLFSGSEKSANQTLVLQLTLSKDDTTGQTIVSQVQYVPVYLYDKGEGAQSRLQLLDVQRAIELYHTDYIDKVDSDTYQALQSCITQLASDTTLSDCTQAAFLQSDS